ncbi:MAG: efflux RND transporter periplasmic adaptor subunit [Halioglobus sp.]
MIIRTRYMLCALLLLAPALAANAQEKSISSLGRLEPHNGVIHLSGPSGNGLTGAVIKELLISEGDWVEKDQVLAYTDSYNLRKTEVGRLQAILDNAQREMSRQSNLSKTSATSKVKLDEAEMQLSIAQADIKAARARMELSVVRSPMRAQVLEVHAQPGERVGDQGIMELGQTDRMYAVAEVYETDITAVNIGQSARITTPALKEPVTGKVERVALMIGRMDALGTDPIAKTDARVVEVFILLDEPEALSALTNLQVEVEILP